MSESNQQNEDFKYIPEENINSREDTNQGETPGEKKQGEDIFSGYEIPWSKGGEPCGDIVLSSRIRLARNLEGEVFPHKLPPKGARALSQKLAKAIEALPEYKFTYYDIMLLTPLKRQSLLEKHIISPELAQGRAGSGVGISKDAKAAIMVNEEDHLRLQVFTPGLQLEKAWERASKLEDYLAKELNLAFNPQFGFLTACPTNVGTGLRASAMLHLPALVMAKEAEEIFANLPRLGLTVRGLYGEGSKARGNLFQISNQITLGKSEEEIIDILKSAITNIVGAERKARLLWREKNPILLYDGIWRSYGILLYGRTITSQEMMERLSQIRLGMDMGIIKGLTRAKINEMMMKGQPAYLELNSNKALTPGLRDWERAEILRNILAENAEVKNND